MIIAISGHTFYTESRWLTLNLKETVAFIYNVYFCSILGLHQNTYIPPADPERLLMVASR